MIQVNRGIDAGQGEGELHALDELLIAQLDLLAEPNVAKTHLGRRGDELPVSASRAAMVGHVSRRAAQHIAMQAINAQPDGYLHQP